MAAKRASETARSLSAFGGLAENEVHALLEGIWAEFGDRQLKIDDLLRRRFDEDSSDLLNSQSHAVDPASR